MTARMSQICALLCVAGLPICVGCSRDREYAMQSGESCNITDRPTMCGSEWTRASRETTTTTACAQQQTSSLPEYPPNAQPGECYGKVYVPAKYETKTERLCTKEACERLEIVPARYEWVEDRVLVKEASTELQEIPAEYKSAERTIEVKPGHTEWVMANSDKCRSENGQPVRQVYCLVSTPPETKTVNTQCLARPACTKEVPVAAEYQTIRRQKLIAPATTMRVTIPAEFENVEKNICVASGHMEWQRVICDADATPVTLNAVKSALMANGYKTGPLDGQLGKDDWNSLRAYQQKKGLGVGELSYETLNSLQVSVR